MLDEDLISESRRIGITQVAKAIESLAPQQIQELFQSLERRARVEGRDEVADLLRILVAAKNTREKALLQCLEMVCNESLSGPSTFMVVSELHLGVKLQGSRDNVAALAFLRDLCEFAVKLLMRETFGEGAGKVMDLLPTILHTCLHIKTGEALISSTMSGILECTWPPNAVLPVLDALVRSPLDAQYESAVAKKLRDEHASPPPSDITAIVQAMLGFCDRTRNKLWCEAIRETLRRVPAAVRGNVYAVLALMVKQSGVLAKLIRASIISDETRQIQASDVTLLVTVAFTDLDGPDETLSLLLARLAKFVKSQNQSIATLSIILERVAASEEMSERCENLLFLCRAAATSRTVAPVVEKFLFDIFVHHPTGRSDVLSLALGTLLERQGCSDGANASAGNSRKKRAVETDATAKMMLAALEKIFQRPHLMADLTGPIFEWLPHLWVLPLHFSQPLLWWCLPVCLKSAANLDRVFIILRKESMSPDLARRALALDGLCRTMQITAGSGESEKECVSLLIEGLRSHQCGLVCRSLGFLLANTAMSAASRDTVTSHLLSRFDKIGFSQRRNFYDVLEAFSSSPGPLYGRLKQDLPSLLLPLSLLPSPPQKVLATISNISIWIRNDASVAPWLSISPSPKISPLFSGTDKVDFSKIEKLGISIGVISNGFLVPMCHGLAIFALASSHAAENENNATGASALFWMKRAAEISLAATLVSAHQLKSSPPYSREVSVISECLPPSLVVDSLCQNSDENNVYCENILSLVHTSARAFSGVTNISQGDGAHASTSSSSSTPIHRIPTLASETDNEWHKNRWRNLDALLNCYINTHRWRDAAPPDSHSSSLVEELTRSGVCDKDGVKIVCLALHYKTRENLVSKLSEEIMRELTECGTWAAFRTASLSQIPTLRTFFPDFNSGSAIESGETAVAKNIISNLKKELSYALPGSVFLKYISLIRACIPPSLFRSPESDEICKNVFDLISRHEIRQRRLVKDVLSFIADAASPKCLSDLCVRALRGDSLKFSVGGETATDRENGEGDTDERDTNGDGLIPILTRAFLSIFTADPAALPPVEISNFISALGHGFENEIFQSKQTRVLTLAASRRMLQYATTLTKKKPKRKGGVDGGSAAQEGAGGKFQILSESLKLGKILKNKILNNSVCPRSEVSIRLKLTYLIEKLSIVPSLRGEVSAGSNNDENPDEENVSEFQFTCVGQGEEAADEGVGAEGAEEVVMREVTGSSRATRKRRLRSRNQVVDRWLVDERDGIDAFADLDEFIVPEEKRERRNPTKWGVVFSNSDQDED